MFFQLTRDCAWSIALQLHAHLSGHWRFWLAFSSHGEQNCLKVSPTYRIHPGLGEGGSPGNSWWGCVTRFSTNADPISDQKMLFSKPVFQTWPLKLIPFFRPGGGHKTQHYMFWHKTEIMSSLLRLKPQPKDFLKSISNSHIYIYYTLIQRRSPFVNHTRFQTKMGKIYTGFLTKTAQKPQAHSYMSYIREYAPPFPPPPPKENTAHESGTLTASFQGCKTARIA